MSDGYEELFLCKPCAEEMKTDKYKTVEDVKYIQSVNKKGTCEQCRCRRFGYRCEVKFKEF
jgi:hypothetical protein